MPTTISPSSLAPSNPEATRSGVGELPTEVLERRGTTERPTDVREHRGARELPTDVLERVFDHLGPHEKARTAAFVCRSWHLAARASVSHRVVEELRACGDAADVCRLLLAQGAALAQLTHLDLRDMHLGDAGTFEVCALLTQRAPALRHLDLSGNALSSAGAASLPFPVWLQTLGLANNDLGRENIPLRLPPYLEGLNLSCNPALDAAYLACQSWPSSLCLLMAAVCNVGAWSAVDPPAHLDVSFNPHLTLTLTSAHGQPDAWPAHLDVRGTPYSASASRLTAHPAERLERLFVYPLAESRSDVVTRGRVTAAIGAVVGAALGTALAAICSPLKGTAGCLAMGAVPGALGGLASGKLSQATDAAHLTAHAHAIKRGGPPWHRPDSAPVYPREVPRAAAVLQCLANGVLGGVMTGMLTSAKPVGDYVFDHAKEVAQFRNLEARLISLVGDALPESYSRWATCICWAGLVTVLQLRATSRFYSAVQTLTRWSAHQTARGTYWLGARWSA